MPWLTHLECARCEKEYDITRLQNLCECGSPLLARYDLESIGEAVDRDQMESGPDNMWRFAPLLPVPDGKIVTRGEGMTPLLEASRLQTSLGVGRFLLKDEGLNPTGTFKARGAACGVSMASYLGADAVAMPTAGNAGGAWSAYAAVAGLECHVAMPKDAPELTQKECFLFGAETHLVDGLISDAGKLIAEAAAERGWFEVTTLKEPYRIEGKKTMGLEMALQLGWRVPDAVVYPAGGGVGLIGIWKALQEMESLGWIGEERPKMIAVQSEGCAPLVEAYEQGRRESDFWEGAETLAGGIRVPKAIGDFLVMDAVYESGGCAISVSDEDILRALQMTARSEGMFICPEGAASVAAVEKLIEDGFLSSEDEVLVVNTGSGLKYSSLVSVDLPVVDAGSSILS